MRIFLSIFFNGLILYGMSYLLPEIVATGGIKLYFVAGVVLGLLNTFIKPILKILGFPFVIITFGLFTLVINGVILGLLQKIIEILNIVGVTYSFGGWVNFAIAVVIFSIFNTLYGTFFKH
ncbi:MAG: phage holin family protein [Candidatus Gracilibacteria bacterium]|nr:phage holin family protein [Candidatus Gracilibacteria bacterium]